MNKIIEDNLSAIELCAKSLEQVRFEKPRVDKHGKILDTFNYDPVVVSNHIQRASKSYDQLQSMLTKEVRIPKHRFSSSVVEIVNLLNDLEMLRAKEDCLKVRELIVIIETYLNSGKSIDDQYRETVAKINDLECEKAMSEDLVNQLRKELEETNSSLNQAILQLAKAEELSSLSDVELTVRNNELSKCRSENFNLRFYEAFVKSSLKLQLFHYTIHVLKDTKPIGLS